MYLTYIYIYILKLFLDSFQKINYVKNIYKIFFEQLNLRNI